MFNRGPVPPPDPRALTEEERAQYDEQYRAYQQERMRAIKKQQAFIITFIGLLILAAIGWVAVEFYRNYGIGGLINAMFVALIGVVGFSFIMDQVEKRL